MQHFFAGIGEYGDALWIALEVLTLPKIENNLKPNVEMHSSGSDVLRFPNGITN
jgi:hypothetical protein